MKKVKNILTVLATLLVLANVAVARTFSAGSVNAVGVEFQSLEVLMNQHNVQLPVNEKYIVISKRDLLLYVCENSQSGSPHLVASYPVCVGLNYGDKVTPGDMRTPETDSFVPFTITQIAKSSNWRHNFKDGRGSIRAYGDWFLRLSAGNGIGIHGSTNNEKSVPGRASEGCIRLHDADIIALKEQYAFVGMKVFVLPD